MLVLPKKAWETEIDYYVEAEVKVATIEVVAGIIE